MLAFALNGAGDETMPNGMTTDLANGLLALFVGAAAVVVVVVATRKLTKLLL